MTVPGLRKIIHIDMDAFYASIEQRDNPALRGKPIAVGGSARRGVVAAASYEARKFGVRSAMPSVLAAKKCPELTFISPRFEVYRKVSEQIRNIFNEYTDLIEPLSLDEAFLDVTQNKKSIPYAMDVANEIRERIKNDLNLTASAGISFNKFLAKVASDINKPNGFFVITPKAAQKFIDELPIRKFFGVGKVTAEKMNSKGIFTGAHLRSQPRENLVKWFGKSGRYFYRVARAQDERPVNPNRERKSVGAERTFSNDIMKKEELNEKIRDIAEILIRRLRKTGKKGRTLTLKVKYSDFHQITRNSTLDHNYSEDLITKNALDMLEKIPYADRGIRLLGLQLSNFYDQPAGEKTWSMMDSSDSGQLSIKF